MAARESNSNLSISINRTISTWPPGNPIKIFLSINRIIIWSPGYLILKFLSLKKRHYFNMAAEESNFSSILKSINQYGRRGNIF